MRLAWLGVIFNNRRSRRLGSRIIIIIKALEPIKRGSVTCSTRKHKHKQPRATIIINISKQLVTLRAAMKTVTHL